MGILSNLLGLNQTQMPLPPVMTTVLPLTAQSLIEKGKLPKLNTQTLLLEHGEICHYVDKACMVKEITRTRYSGGHGGFSIKLTKGLTYRTGRSHSTPINEKIPEYTPGYLYITNYRVVFVAKENGFDKKIKALTAVIPYSDAISLQFSEKTYNLLLPTPDLAVGVMHMIK